MARFIEEMEQHRGGMGAGAVEKRGELTRRHLPADLAGVAAVVEEVGVDVEGDRDSGVAEDPADTERRALNSAADRAGLNDDGWPRLRFHDLRHTFASHLIIDLRLDVAQVSRILSHARVTTTLDVYTHMFDEARHTLDVRAQMAGSAFAGLLEHGEEGEEQAGSVITLPRTRSDRVGRLSAKERAALRWAT